MWSVVLITTSTVFLVLNISMLVRLKDLRMLMCVRDCLPKARARFYKCFSKSNTMIIEALFGFMFTYTRVKLT